MAKNEIMNDEVKTENVNVLNAGDLNAKFDAESEAGEVVAVPTGEPVFPGLKLRRFGFQYKGTIHYGYKLCIQAPGTTMKFEAEFVSADKKSVDTYSRLDELWGMLPEGQDWMDLGLIRNDYLNSWDYCVQVSTLGFPVRLTLRLKNQLSRDSMISIIAILQKYGKL